jgi:hypothetical protein
MNKKKFKDILMRALKTFIQAFIAAFLLGTSNLSNLDKKVVESALLGGLAAGISAVMNLVGNLLDKGDE